MMGKPVLLLIAFAFFPLFGVGCGASGSPGVASAPDQPTPELTPDEQKAEAESARAASQ